MQSCNKTAHSSRDTKRSDGADWPALGPSTTDLGDVVRVDVDVVDPDECVQESAATAMSSTPKSTDAPFSQWWVVV
ncbi:hypothetical protein [Corynebacterium sp.]|uniref:hypothetical protein n=1 Tax=Corynebacterium sp. TaxID=1720 RepID=UPI002648308C|nr:hypothetical protein [Corynebacterium sp.]MDN5721199.1 hypothetical protein [Corynebacterium sp.]